MRESLHGGANLLSDATFGKNKRFDYFSLSPIFVDVSTEKRECRWFGAEGKVHVLLTVHDILSVVKARTTRFISERAEF